MITQGEANYILAEIKAYKDAEEIVKCIFENTTNASIKASAESLQGSLENAVYLQSCGDFKAADLTRSFAVPQVMVLFRKAVEAGLTW